MLEIADKYDQLEEPARCAERRYRDYVKDRDNGLAHEQIVSEGGCVGREEADRFGARYSSDKAAYAEAMTRRDLGRFNDNSIREERPMTPWGERIRAGQ